VRNVFRDGDIIESRYPPHEKYKILMLTETGAWLRPLVNRKEIEELKTEIEKTLSKTIALPGYVRLNWELVVEDYVFEYPFDEEDWKLVRHGKLTDEDVKLIRRIIRKRKK